MTSLAEGLPDLASAYALNDEAIAEYRRDGHVLLRGVASVEEVAAFRPAIAACVSRKAKDAPPLAQRDTYHKAFLQVGNLWEEDAAVARFTCAKRFARIAAELMGAEGVRLYHDQALFKEAGGGATPWHQDQYYWPLEGEFCTTMWMPLVDVPEEMGVLTFASGSHRDGCLLARAISEESDAALQKLVDERGYPVARSAMRAGDATFHSGWCVHMAPPNHTERVREIMTVIYFADGLRICEPDNPHRPIDLARFFPGQKPGEVAGGPLNPLLYHVDRGE